MALSTLRIVHRGSLGAADPDQCVVDVSLGLLAVATPSRADARGRGAARMALDALRSHVGHHADLLDRFRRRPAPELRTEILGLLQEAVQRAAGETYALTRRGEPLLVTLDAVLALDHEAFVVHIGDGRVYLVRRGLAHQLTTDHVESEPVIGESAAGRASRGLGREPRVRCESLCMELGGGDRMMVLSGDLPHAINDATLHQTIAQGALDDLEARLVAVAGQTSVVAAIAQLPGQVGTRKDSGAERLAVLAPMALFEHCSELELRAVAAATVPRRYPPGGVLFRKGEPGVELFLLVAGSVIIEGEDGVLATLGPGTAFGEMALLDEPMRSASARAVDAVEALVIPRDAFFRLLRGNPPLAVKILWNMLLRLSGNLRRTSEQVASLQAKLQTQAGTKVPAPR